jgi:hypothetical protein
MAEILIDPKTGFAISLKLDTDLDRNGEPRRWGLLEEKYFGVVTKSDEELKDVKLSDLKIDLAKLSEKQKADMADRDKVARFDAPLIEKSTDEKAADAALSLERNK